MKNKVNLFLKSLFVIMVLLIFYRTFFVETEYWSGVYYPKGNGEGNAIYSPHFQYKEECIGWAINERGLRPEDAEVPLGDLWECNKNCRLAGDYVTLLYSDKQNILKDNTGPLFYCDDGGFDGADWLRGDF